MFLPVGALPSWPKAHWSNCVREQQGAAMRALVAWKDSDGTALGSHVEAAGCSTHPDPPTVPNTRSNSTTAIYNTLVT
eukprot:9491091-Pyramimonas_sp.AAC.1